MSDIRTQTFGMFGPPGIHTLDSQSEFCSQRIGIGTQNFGIPGPLDVHELDSQSESCSQGISSTFNFILIIIETYE